MANPDYATLLPLIAAETDPVARQALIDQAYQFNETLTDDEIEVFGYVNYDYVRDVDNDYSVFTEYVGAYYNAEGENSLTQRIATQKLNITSVTKVVQPSEEGNFGGTYTITVEADQPLTITLRFRLTMYLRGGTTLFPRQLGIEDAVLNAGESVGTYTVFVSASWNTIGDDVYTNSNFELFTEISDVYNIQYLPDAEGDDYAFALTEVIDTFEVTPIISFASVTPTSSVFNIGFSSLSFAEAIPKVSFSVNATVITGSSVYSFPNVLQIQANSNNASVANTIAIPQGTNFYDTPGNVAIVQLSAVGNTGYENLVFTSSSLTTARDQVFDAVQTIANNYISASDPSVMLPLIAAQGFTPIAAATSGQVAEALLGRDPFNNWGFNLPAFVAGTGLGLSTGMINPIMNGRPEMIIMMFDRPSAGNERYLGTLSMCFAGNNGSFDDTSVPATIGEVFSLIDGNPRPDTTFSRWKIYATAWDELDFSAATSFDGTTLWNFSDGQNPGAGGYYLQSKFSLDDGLWGVRLGTSMQGNEGVPFTTDNIYAIANMNAADSASVARWGAITPVNPYVYIFTR